MGFSEKDLSQIEKKGITSEKVEKQIQIFKRGNITVNIREAATPRNGILQIHEPERTDLIRLYDTRCDKLNILKFVPASGAATRMFKALYNFVKEFEPQQETLEQYLNRKNNQKLETFFSRM
ncbi:DUF4301 family protein, partial [Longispora fulva]|uniref:DUF4301 family protein n=3 Tax=Bacteria TaxID=2 RepID=UPI003644671C